MGLIDGHGDIQTETHAKLLYIGIYALFGMACTQI